MRKIINVNEDWLFIKSDVGAENAAAATEGEKVNVPYTWNNIDGQDGGDDYVRGAFWFVKRFAKPEFKDNETVYLEFKGVNSSAQVYLNGEKVASHDGGYSTFRAEVKSLLKDDNILCVRADNSKTEKVYPQTADFTFYGGIYRDVNILVVNENHFDLDYYGAPGIKIDPIVDGTDGYVTVTGYVKGEGEVAVSILTADGQIAASGKGGEKLKIENAHLWNGVEDPYLYTAKAELTVGGKAVDEVCLNFGFRYFSVDPNKGFFLNGKSYPLRGVCRHQDRKGLGNAITRAEHDEDAAIIKEIGANTVRLAHYQHDDYFYDLCDKYGFVVWAEIPYISRHMPEANENAVQQMKELIYQQHHHACICFWGVSNEITMYGKHKKDMLAQHRRLNDLCHEIDPSRLTTLACFAMCGFNNRSAHITDVVSWNLYLGWYVPGKFLNGLWMGLFRMLHPKRCIGLSEYGAECMPNLHSKHPKRGDNSEEYQLDYHEYMLDFFDRHPYLWATHVWNMYDFAADARNQGGEPGMNHKGLVTFDRKTKKDSFFIYKAYWSKEPFVYICGKRFANRTGGSTVIKVVSNLDDVALTVNGKSVRGKKVGKHSFEFKIKLEKVNEIRAESGEYFDECVINKVDKPDYNYKLHVKSETQSWQK